MPSSRFNCTEQLKRAIWCEIYMVNTGYIPYLRSFTQRGLERMADEEDKSRPNIEEYYNKQRNLEKLVESLNDKLQKLETQPVGGRDLLHPQHKIFQVHLET